MTLQCQDCARDNPVWFAPNAVWNLALGGPDAKGDPGGILCPLCFIRRAEAAGIVPTGWELRPEAPDLDELRDALHDLVQLRSEAFAIGGGPGFKEREAAAWRRAAELFEP